MISLWERLDIVEMIHTYNEKTATKLLTEFDNSLQLIENFSSKHYSKLFICYVIYVN